MGLNLLQDTPEPVLDTDFDENNEVKSNYGEWDDKTKVRYAVQLRVDGVYSRFSDWSNPLKVDGKANPILQIPSDEKERERLVFRKFNDDKPQLAGVLTGHKMEFHDINRDLYDAARSKDQTRPLEYIPILLDAGANVNATFEMNRGAMHAAAESGNVKIAMRFLLLPELLNAKDDKGFTPIHIAAMTKNAGFVRFLIDQNADVNAQTTGDKLSALHIAAKRGYSKTVQNLLLSEKIDINIRERSGYTPLHYAIRGLPSTVRIFIENDNVLANAVSESGLTPFHLAVIKGDRKICDVLLSNEKVDVNAKENEGMTPLHFAVMAGNVDMIRYLLSEKKEVEKVDVNAVTSKKNWTPLFLAIYLKQENAAIELLKNAKVDLSIASSENYTPLHLAVATNQENVFDELLKKNPNLEASTKEGFTALHLSALKSEAGFTDKLLDKNANINAVADDGSTPLHMATKSDKTDQILLLIKRGANIKIYDSKNFLPLQYSIQNLNVKAIKEAIKQDPSIVNFKNNEGKGMLKYTISFISYKMFYYYQNKETAEFRKYKKLQPFEVYQKLGYYDLIYALANNPEDEKSINDTMRMLDSLAIYCLKKSKEPNEKQCKMQIEHSKRSIKNFDDNYSSKLQPEFLAQNSVNVLSNLNKRHSLIEKATKGTSFSQNVENSTMQSVDTNGALLLLDLFVRKLTNEKYGQKIGKPASKLESQAEALEIIEKFRAFVDSVSHVPAEELIDLAKLHSDVYKSIENGKRSKVFDLFCEELHGVANPEQILAFLEEISTDKDLSDQNQDNPFNNIVQYCFSTSGNNTIF